MAEQRFPSIEDFSEDTPLPSGPSGNTSTAEQSFLDRERAALGDDADFFASPNDAKVTGITNGNDDDDDDLLGGDDDQATQHNNNNNNNNNNKEALDFQQNYPSIDARNQALGPDGTITSSNLPSSTNNASAIEEQQEEESEPVKSWRSRRSLALTHRAEVSTSKKTSTIASAHASIDEFYEAYNAKKEKSIAQTRKEAETFMEGREDTVSGGTAWERIGRLVDLTKKGSVQQQSVTGSGSGAGSGKEKFREVLISLRKDESAPGAKGI